MSDEKENVEAAAEEAVVVVDEAPETDQVVVEVADADDNVDTLDPEKGIAELKRNLKLATEQAERERQLRIQSEQIARDRTIAAQQAQLRAVQTEYQSVQDGIAFLKSRDARLIDEWKDAKSMGDYAREAELQRDWMKTQEDIRALEYRRGAMENFLRNPPAPEPPPQADPLERWFVENRVSEPTAAWARKHRNLFETEDSVSLVRAAHFKAIGNGLRADSAAYFKAVEEELGLREKPAPEEDVDDTPVSSASARVGSARRSSPPPAAPVSRGSTRKGVVHLSAAEKEAAEISGVSYEEYYRNQQRDKERARR